MKKMLYSTIVALLMIGCSFNGVRQVRQTAALEKTQTAVINQTRLMNDTTVSALFRETNSTPPIKLARKTSSEAQLLIGRHPYETIDVDAILATNKQEVAKLNQQFEVDKPLLKTQYTQTEKLNETDKQLIELGKIKEQEMNANKWWQFWTWSSITLTIAGFIALCVFTPLGPIILNGLLGWLWLIIPRIASFFRVAPVKVFDNVAKGIENFKWRTETEPVFIQSDKTKSFSYEEVEKLIKEERAEMLSVMKHELAKATDADDKKIISSRKDYLNLG